MNYRDMSVWTVELTAIGGDVVRHGTVVAEDMRGALAKAAGWWSPRTTLAAHVTFVRSLADVERLTKWDLVDDDTRAHLDSLPGDYTCTECRTELATEGDFARHFTVTDYRYRNLGTCPRPVAS